MSLAPLLVRIAQGDRLSVAEAEHLQSLVSRIEGSMLVSSGPSSADIIPLLQFAALDSAVAQSLPSGTQTALVWDRRFVGSAEAALSWSSAESSALRMRATPDARAYIIWGHVHWATNTSGARTIVFERTDTSGGIYDDILAQVDTSTAVTAVPFVGLWEVGRSSVGAAFSEARATLDVTQDSGGNLNVTFAILNVAKVF